MCYSLEAVGGRVTLCIADYERFIESYVVHIVIVLFYGYSYWLLSSPSWFSYRRRQTISRGVNVTRQYTLVLLLLSTNNQCTCYTLLHYIHYCAFNLYLINTDFTHIYLYVLSIIITDISSSLLSPTTIYQQHQHHIDDSL